ncbi:hypothetical protein D9M68_513530 [compost metagenome]
MDDGRAGGQQVVAARGDFAQLAADDEQAVGLGDQFVGDAAIAAEQAGVQRVAAGDRALAAHGVRDRDAEAAGERLHGVGGVADVDTAAAQHQRAGGAGQHAGRLLEIAACRPAAQRGRAAIVGAGIERVRVEGVDLVRDVLGDVQHHGAGPAAGRNRERAAHQLRNALDLLHAQHVLDDGAQHFQLARFLRHVLPRVHPVRIAHQGHHRRARVVGLRKPCHQVGRARSQRGVAHARTAADLGVGIGGEDRAALVVDEVVVQLQAARGVIERQQLEAAHAEHQADFMRGKHARDGFAARDFQFFRHAGFAPSGCRALQAGHR